MQVYECVCLLLDVLASVSFIDCQLFSVDQIVKNSLTQRENSSHNNNWHNNHIHTHTPFTHYVGCLSLSLSHSMSHTCTQWEQVETRCLATHGLEARMPQSANLVSLKVSSGQAALAEHNQRNLCVRARFSSVHKLLLLAHTKSSALRRLCGWPPPLPTSLLAFYFQLLSNCPLMWMLQIFSKNK